MMSHFFYRGEEGFKFTFHLKKLKNKFATKNANFGMYFNYNIFYYYFWCSITNIIHLVPFPGIKISRYTI